MHGRRSELEFWTTAVFLWYATAAHAAGPDQAGESRELIATTIAFPLLTIATSLGLVLLGRRAGHAHSMLRAVLGALVGLILSVGLGLALMADDARDAAFVATSLFTLGAIPTGLIGLVVGGLAGLQRREEP